MEYIDTNTALLDGVHLQYGMDRCHDKYELYNGFSLVSF